MRGFLNLFGRSPFLPLQKHMQDVARCVHLLSELFEALKTENFELLNKIAASISYHEHEADQTKNDIRNHMPKGLFLAIDRSYILEILTIQDDIADKCEDIAVLVTLKPVTLPPRFKEDFQSFLNKTFEAFNEVHDIMRDFHDLLESSFGGLEAEKVRSMVDKVSFIENEADIQQRQLLKNVFNHEEEFTFMTFNLWQHVFEALACISNLSEKLANRIRMTLEVK